MRGFKSISQLIAEYHIHDDAAKRLQIEADNYTSLFNSARTDTLKETCQLLAELSIDQKNIHLAEMQRIEQLIHAYKFRNDE